MVVGSKKQYERVWCERWCACGVLSGCVAVVIVVIVVIVVGVEEVEEVDPFLFRPVDVLRGD